MAANNNHHQQEERWKITYSEDREGIALLRQFFADEPIDELKKLHHERIEQERVKRLHSQQQSTPPTTSSLNLAKTSHPRTMDLPDDFLRLPSNVAVLRFAGRRRYDNNIV